VIRVTAIRESDEHSIERPFVRGARRGEERTIPTNDTIAVVFENLVALRRNGQTLQKEEGREIGQPERGRGSSVEETDRQADKEQQPWP